MVVPTHNTDVTPRRVRAIQVVAASFFLNGVVNLLFAVVLKLADYRFGPLVSLGTIGDIVVGIGLLSFSRGAYVAGLWWASLKLLAYGVGLVRLVVLRVRVSQLEYPSILQIFDRAMT